MQSLLSSDMDRPKQAVVFPGYVYVFVIPSEPGSVKVGFTQRSPTERMRNWAAIANDTPRELMCWYSVQCYLAMQLLSRTLQRDAAPQRIHDSDYCFCESFSESSGVKADSLPVHVFTMILTKVASMTASIMASDAVPTGTLFRYVRKYKLLDSQEIKQAEAAYTKPQLIRLIEQRLTECGTGFGSFKFDELSKNKLIALANQKSAAAVAGLPPLSPAPKSPAVAAAGAGGVAESHTPGSAKSGGASNRNLLPDGKEFTGVLGLPKGSSAVAAFKARRASLARGAGAAAGAVGVEGVADAPAPSAAAAAAAAAVAGGPKPPSTPAPPSAAVATPSKAGGMVIPKKVGLSAEERAQRATYRAAEFAAFAAMQKQLLAEQQLKSAAEGASPVAAVSTPLSAHILPSPANRPSLPALSPHPPSSTPPPSAAAAGVSANGNPVTVAAVTASVLHNTPRPSLVFTPNSNFYQSAGGGGTPPFAAFAPLNGVTPIAVSRQSSAPSPQPPASVNGSPSMNPHPPPPSYAVAMGGAAAAGSAPSSEPPSPLDPLLALQRAGQQQLQAQHLQQQRSLTLQHQNSQRSLQALVSPHSAVAASPVASPLTPQYSPQQQHQHQQQLIAQQHAYALQQQQQQQQQRSQSPAPAAVSQLQAQAAALAAAQAAAEAQLAQTTAQLQALQIAQANAKAQVAAAAFQRQQTLAQLNGAQQLQQQQQMQAAQAAQAAQAQAYEQQNAAATIAAQQQQIAALRQQLHHSQSQSQLMQPAASPPAAAAASLTPKPPQSPYPYGQPSPPANSQLAELQAQAAAQQYAVQQQRQALAMQQAQQQQQLLAQQHAQQQQLLAQQQQQRAAAAASPSPSPPPQPQLSAEELQAQLTSAQQQIGTMTKIQQALLNQRR